MADEETPQGEQEQKEQETQSEEVVTLSPEQYAALLDRIDEAETKSKTKVLSLDELAEEVKSKPREERRGAEPPKPAKDLNEMTNQELVDYIFQVADASITPALQDLSTKIETVKVLNEIDKLTSKEEFKDFWDYKEEIYKRASENPQLSLEDAYYLATGKAKPKKGTTTDKKATLLTLPPRPVLGERPGHTKAVTTDKETGKTVRSAAIKAWKETMGDKTDI